MKNKPKMNLDQISTSLSTKSTGYLRDGGTQGTFKGPQKTLGDFRGPQGTSGDLREPKLA